MLSPFDIIQHLDLGLTRVATKRFVSEANGQIACGGFQIPIPVEIEFLCHVLDR